MKHEYYLHYLHINNVPCIIIYRNLDCFFLHLKERKKNIKIISWGKKLYADFKIKCNKRD